MNEEQNYTAVEETDREPTKVSGVTCGGPNGELDETSMLWRKARTLGFKERSGWRTVIPCDRCANCMELRRFTESGKIETSGWYCTSGEMETSPYATCNSGKKRRNGRKKVLYDMTNAPVGFNGATEGMEVGEIDESRTAGENLDYRGGSKPVDMKDIKMPRRLMN